MRVRRRVARSRFARRRASARVRAHLTRHYTIGPITANAANANTARTTTARTTTARTTASPTAAHTHNSTHNSTRATTHASTSTTHQRRNSVVCERTRHDRVDGSEHCHRRSRVLAQSADTTPGSTYAPCATGSGNATSAQTARTQRARRRPACCAAAAASNEETSSHVHGHNDAELNNIASATASDLRSPIGTSAQSAATPRSAPICGAGTLRMFWLTISLAAFIAPSEAGARCVRRRSLKQLTAASMAASVSADDAEAPSTPSTCASCRKRTSN
eukprot:3177885-Pleurochrysis_carterae.AAC.2